VSLLTKFSRFVVNVAFTLYYIIIFVGSLGWISATILLCDLWNKADTATRVALGIRGSFLGLPLLFFILKTLRTCFARYGCAFNKDLYKSNIKESLMDNEMAAGGV
jgi:hypothetical protein